MYISCVIGIVAVAITVTIYCVLWMTPLLLLADAAYTIANTN